MKAAESTCVIMSDVLREDADTPVVSELLTAASDLPLSRGAGPQTTAEYEQNKLLQSPDNLTLLLMSGVSSCSKWAAGIIHTSPELRHPHWHLETALSLHSSVTADCLL